MIKKIVCAILLSIVLISCRKDNILIPHLESFTHHYEGSGNLIGRDILSQGNTIVVCGYGNGANTDEDFVLLFTDSAGNEIHRSFVGSTGEDQCWSFAHTLDGGFVIAGWSDVNSPGSNDVLIVKTDADGNQQWSKTYGTAYNDLATHIISVSNGYVVSGIRGSSGDENSWILRLNNEGDTLWTCAYGGNGPDGAMSICDNGNGTYGITGYTNSNGNGGTDGYVMTINDAGTLVGYFPFGTPGYEEPHDIEKTSGGWAITGHAGTNDIHTHSVFLQLMSDDGSPENFFTYGGHEHDGAESMIVFHSQIYIAGRSASHDPNQDAYTVTTDLNGILLNETWIGGTNEDPAYGNYVDDFQILITGYSLNATTGRKDIFLIRK